MTENGVLRIVGSARYPTSPGSPAGVAEMLRTLRSLSGHQFWPDDLTLLDSRFVDSTRLLDTSQVTDTYLLALAAAHGGKLATFDRHLVANAVVDESKALRILG